MGTSLSFGEQKTIHTHYYVCCNQSHRLYLLGDARLLHLQKSRSKEKSVIFHCQSGKAAASRPNDWVHRIRQHRHGEHLRRGTETIIHRIADLGQIRQSRTRWNPRRHSRRRYTRRRVLRRPNVRELRRGEQRIRRLRRRVRFVLLGEIFLVIPRLEREKKRERNASMKRVEERILTQK